MVFGVYLCVSAVVGMVALLIVPQRTGRYLMLASLSTLGCLILFTLLSLWMGVIRFGESRRFSLPHDYLTRGVTGWILLGVLLLGILSPAVIAIVLRERARQPSG